MSRRPSQDIAPDERIILDTGDGVAIRFLGDPEDALFVAMQPVQRLESRDRTPSASTVRTGINLGPVRLVRDINSQPNIIGDGINVAQRVMSFAQPGQVLVSRSYYEVVTRISRGLCALFAYQGSRTDKHVREHELYELVAPGAEAHEIDAPAQPRPQARRGHAAPRRPQPRRALLRNRRLALAFTGISVLALSAARFYYVASAPATRGIEQRSGAPWRHGGRRAACGPLPHRLPPQRAGGETRDGLTDHPPRAVRRRHRSGDRARHTPAVAGRPAAKPAARAPRPTQPVAVPSAPVDRAGAHTRPVWSPTRAGSQEARAARIGGAVETDSRAARARASAAARPDAGRPRWCSSPSRPGARCSWTASPWA